MISQRQPEIVAELVSLQEEISSWPTEIVELPIETLVVLPAERTGASTIFNSYEGLIFS